MGSKATGTRVNLRRFHGDCEPRMTRPPSGSSARSRRSTRAEEIGRLSLRSTWRRVSEPLSSRTTSSSHASGVPVGRYVTPSRAMRTISATRPVLVVVRSRVLSWKQSSSSSAVKRTSTSSRGTPAETHSRTASRLFGACRPDRVAEWQQKVRCRPRMSGRSAADNHPGWASTQQGYRDAVNARGGSSRLVRRHHPMLDRQRRARYGTGSGYWQVAELPRRERPVIYSRAS